MKSKDNKKKKTFEEDYNKIMKTHPVTDPSYFQNPQWTNSGDFIVKFSLLLEIPNSITSTDTLVNL